MTEKDKSPSGYHGSFTYEGESRDYELSKLGFYLGGKPDTPEWRDEFAQQIGGPIIPVEYEGKILPEWAVLDARKLYQEDPEALERSLAKRELSFEDIPLF